MQKILLIGELGEIIRSIKSMTFLLEFAIHFIFSIMKPLKNFTEGEHHEKNSSYL